MDNLFDDWKIEIFTTNPLIKHFHKTTGLRKLLFLFIARLVFYDRNISTNFKSGRMIVKIVSKQRISEKLILCIVFAKRKDFY